MYHVNLLTTQNGSLTGTNQRGAELTLEGVDSMLGDMTFSIGWIVGRVNVQVDQPAAAGTAINGEDLSKLVEQVILKDGVNEWVNAKGQDLRRWVIGELGHEPIDLPQQIAAADGDYIRNIYLAIPFQTAPKNSEDESDFSPPVGVFLGTGTLTIFYSAGEITAFSTGSAIEVLSWQTYVYTYPRHGAVKLSLFTQILEFELGNVGEYELPPGLFDSLYIVRRAASGTQGFPNVGPAIYDQIRLQSGLRLQQRTDTEAIIIGHALIAAEATDDAERVDNGLQAATEAVDVLPIIKRAWKERLTRGWAPISARQKIEWFGASLPTSHLLIGRLVHPWPNADAIGRGLALRLGYRKGYDEAGSVDARRNLGASASLADSIRWILPKRLGAV